MALENVILKSFTFQHLILWRVGHFLRKDYHHCQFMLL